MSYQCYSFGLASEVDTSIPILNEAKILIRASENYERMRIRIKMRDASATWNARIVGGYLYSDEYGSNPTTIKSFQSSNWYYIYFSNNDSTLFISRMDLLEHIQLMTDGQDYSPYVTIDWHSLLFSSVDKIEIYKSPVIDPDFLHRRTDLTLWYTDANNQYIDFDLFTRETALTKLFLIDMVNLFGSTENIGRLTGITELTLTNAPKISCQLSEIAHCTNLTVARLTGMTGLTGDISDIYGLSSLTRIELANTGVAGEVKDLEGMKTCGTLIIRASAHLCYDGTPLNNNQIYTFSFGNDGSITMQ